MLSNPISPAQPSFYSTFEEQLSHKHPFLYTLANRVDWQWFEDKCSHLFDKNASYAKG